MDLRADERLRDPGRLPDLRRLVDRPELAAIFGTLLVFAVFALAAGHSGMFELDGILNWSQLSAYIGLVTVSACLLMIGGEFDLSIGSLIGLSGMVIAIPTVKFGWPLWLSILAAFAVALSFGALNGYLVVRTKLPSFIVTLAFLFILRGLTLGLSIHLANRTIVSGVGELAEADWLARTLFRGDVGASVFTWAAGQGWIAALPDGRPVAQGVPKVIVWWAVLAAGASFVLLRTRFGNWIAAVGGDRLAAENLGIPVRRVKIALFMFTSFTAALFAALQVVEVGSAAADRGIQKEFEAIIGAVIGGTLLSGGFGSVIGACFGALIFGVVQIGIGYTNLDSDWFRVFLGLMLLGAVLFNSLVRRRLLGAGAP